MSSIISLVTQKGGSGKSTLAVNIADGLYRSQPDKRIVAIDMDKQQSLQQWYAFNQQHNPSHGHSKPAFAVQSIPEHLTGQAALNALLEIANNYDYVIVDTPGAAGQQARQAMVLSDVILVVVETSLLSLRAAQTTVREIDTLLKAQPDKRVEVRLLLNKLRLNTAVGKQPERYLSEYKPFDLLPTKISNRLAYIESLDAGRSVLDWHYDPIAQQEIQALTQDVLALLPSPPLTDNHTLDQDQDQEKAV